MLPFLKKKEGSVSEPVETIKRDEDNKPKTELASVRKALEQAKESINQALSLLGDE